MQLIDQKQIYITWTSFYFSELKERLKRSIEDTDKAKT